MTTTIINYIVAHWVEIVGSLLGLIYLYFEYKADIKMWATGIFMSTFYTYIFFDSKFYAFAVINIYYIIAGIYGWIKWSKTTKSDKKEKDLQLKQTPTRLYVPLVISLSIIFIIISIGLKYGTDSSIIYGDSFITTLSIVAMWMLAHKYIEQWILLIILNSVSVFIYFDQMLYPTSCLYIIYTIASLFGYLRWKKLLN